MNNQRVNEEEIIDGLKIICYCKGIPKKVFLRHMKNGLTTVDALKFVTGAGGGNCRGRRCTPRIEALLEERQKMK